MAPTNDLIRFWRSKVKVTAGRRGGDAFVCLYVKCGTILYTKLLAFSGRRGIGVEGVQMSTS